MTIVFYLIIAACGAARTTSNNPELKQVCNICCDSVITSDIVFSEHYEGFILQSTKMDLQHAGIDILAEEFILLSAIEIEEVEQNLLKQFDVMFKDIVADTAMTYVRFKDYVRQYVGYIDKEGNRKAIVSFNYRPLLEDFCSSYYSSMKSRIVRNHFQRSGLDFVTIYDFKDRTFTLYNN